MKGNEKLIDVLNELLADELTAISQYILHAEMCDNWGYKKLHNAIEKQARDEMHHAEWLIERILYLEGMPIVNKLNPMKIGKSVPELIKNDLEAEKEAVPAYNKAIGLAGEMGDEATADLLVEILKMEEDHIDWAKKQLTQVDQMGLDRYLTTQTEGASH